MCQLNWDPMTNNQLYPRLMAALQEALDNNYDPEVDECSALDALDVPYELDEDGKPQIDPVATWPVSAVREIAAQTRKSIDYLLGESTSELVIQTSREECIDRLQHTQSELKRLSNAADELKDIIAPELPVGKKELFTVVCEGLYSELRDLAYCVGGVASDIAGEDANA